MIKNVLLLTTRDIGGRSTGRKQVLRTIATSIASSGFNLKIISFSKQSAISAVSEYGSQYEIIYIGRPRILRVLINIFFYFIPAKLSLNECLYYSPIMLKKIKDEAKTHNVDVIVTDMIRLAPYGEKGGAKWILDLDDLLSKRYEAILAKHEITDSFLGYWGESIPQVFRTFLLKALSVILKREAAVLRKRELYTARSSDAVCLVSTLEAEELAKLSGSNVYAMPMAIDTPSLISNKPRGGEGVFIGGLDYQPNLDAIRYYKKEVVPILVKKGITFKLSVIGYCDACHKEELASEHIVFKGYVEALGTELMKHSIFIAPIVGGTGIKTKVLEAMSFGLPVIATKEAVKGMAVAHMEHCLIVDSPMDFVDYVIEFKNNPVLALRLAENGQDYVHQNFSKSNLQAKWRQLLRAL